MKIQMVFYGCTWNCHQQNYQEQDFENTRFAFSTAEFPRRRLRWRGEGRIRGWLRRGSITSVRCRLRRRLVTGCRNAGAALRAETNSLIILGSAICTKSHIPLLIAARVNYIAL
jgi:hypothetical protein